MSSCSHIFFGLAKEERNPSTQFFFTQVTGKFWQSVTQKVTLSFNERKATFTKTNSHLLDMLKYGSNLGVFCSPLINFVI